MKNFKLSQAVSRKLKLPKLNATKIFRDQELIAIHYGDYKVAEGIINDIKKNNPSGVDIEGKRTKLYPDFSTDMNTAMVLIKPMAKAGYNFKLISLFGESHKAIFSPIGSGSGGIFLDEHAPTVILRAAAKALGVLSE